MRIVTCSVWATYFNDLLRFVIYEVRIITAYALATVLRNEAETLQMFSYHYLIDGSGWNPTVVLGHKPKDSPSEFGLVIWVAVFLYHWRVLQTDTATNATVRAHSIIASRPKRECNCVYSFFILPQC